MNLKERINNLENDIKEELYQICKNVNRYLEFLKFESTITTDNIQNAILLFKLDNNIDLVQTSQSFFKSNIPVRVNEKGYNQLIDVEKKYINRDGVEVPLGKATKDEWNKINNGSLSVITKKEKSITKVFDIKQTICSDSMIKRIIDKTNNYYEQDLLKDSIYSFMKTKKMDIDYKQDLSEMISSVVKNEKEDINIINLTTTILICNHYGIEVNEDIKKDIDNALFNTMLNNNIDEMFNMIKKADNDFEVLTKEMDDSIIPFINTIEKSRKEINREEYER